MANIEHFFALILQHKVLYIPYPILIFMRLTQAHLGHTYLLNNVIVH